MGNRPLANCAQKKRCRSAMSACRLISAFVFRLLNSRISLNPYFQASRIVCEAAQTELSDLEGNPEDSFLEMRLK